MPTAVDVLQATTSALTSRSTSASRASVEKRRTSSSERGPYGARALSPRYVVDSCGSRRTISWRTGRPPTPESKTPIGRGSDTGDRLAASGGHRHASCAEQLPREPDDVLADRGVGVGE